MSEVDDLMVDLMMRGDSEAENATVRLIRMAELGELSEQENRHVMKAVERRMKKVKSGTDLHDFLLRLAKFVDPAAQPKTSELPPDMDSPDAVLARKMRGDITPANYEAPEENPPTDIDISDYYHPRENRTNPSNNEPPAEYYHPDNARKKKKKFDDNDR